MDIKIKIATVFIAALLFSWVAIETASAQPRHTHDMRWQMAYNQANANRVFIFDPKRLRWYAYNERGRLVASGRASGGRGYCADVGRSCRTPSGHFRVHRIGSSNCRSSKYPLGRGGAPMPYCMFFYKGFAIHGSPDVPDYNASHGCVRVTPKAARWLHTYFMRKGTKVIVRPY